MINTATKNRELLKLYRIFTYEQMLRPLRIMLICGAVLFLCFHFFDREIYPQQAELFLKVRLSVDCIFALLVAFSFIPRFKSLVLLLVPAAILAIGFAVSFMVYKTGGGHSRYYEGFHVIFLALPVVNRYYLRTNLITGWLVLLSYLLAVQLHPKTTHLLTNWVGVFNIAVTYVWMCLMSHILARHNLKQFLQREELRENEKRIEENYRELGRLYGEVELIARTDDLTKVPNRRLLFEVLDDKIAKAVEHKESFYLIIFDIDHFKKINDQFGHAVGDHVICEVAQTVKRNIRQGSFIARYGGDEFVVLFGDGSREKILSRLSSIASHANKIVLLQDGQKVQVSISVGAARFNPERHKNAEQLINDADGALLQVKKTNRGELLLAEEMPGRAA